MFRSSSAPTASAALVGEVREDVAEILRIRRFAEPEQPAGRRGSACTCHTPERSGLPLSLGAGPPMLILPSRVRGAPAIGSFSHWAPTGSPDARQMTAVRSFIIVTNHNRPCDGERSIVTRPPAAPASSPAPHVPLTAGLRHHPRPDIVQGTHGGIDPIRRSSAVRRGKGVVRTRDLYSVYRAPSAKNRLSPDENLRSIHGPAGFRATRINVEVE